jgi:hypothetical protein
MFHESMGEILREGRFWLHSMGEPRARKRPKKFVHECLGEITLGMMGAYYRDKINTTMLTMVVLMPTRCRYAQCLVSAAAAGITARSTRYIHFFPPIDNNYKY